MQIFRGIPPSATPVALTIGNFDGIHLGHQAMLERLGKRPLLDLGMRLGEGTGAALAMPLLDAAVRVLTEVATFAEAAVSEAQQ